MDRTVQPELLDSLPPEDPRAVSARGGLRRVNALMGNARILTTALIGCEVQRVRRIADLGAGDGAFAFALARRLARVWGPDITVDLVDRQPSLDASVQEGFRKIGWNARVHQCDVMDWLTAAPQDRVDIVIANLFLHHFKGPELRGLLEKIAARCRCFASCDPIRSAPAVRCCPLLLLIGCNAVVRNDAAISIRAGFKGSELTALWPNDARWETEERPGGLFSHLFVAREKRGSSNHDNQTPFLH